MMTAPDTSVATEYDMGTRYEANGWTYPLYNGGTNHGTSAKNMTSVDGDTVVLKPYWNLIVDSVEPALTCYTTNTGESGGVQITASKDPLHTKDTFNSIYNGRYYQYRDKITTYTFTGWYTSRTGGSKVTSFSAPSGSGDDNKTTYYAHYTEAVSYDYNVYPSSGIVIKEPAGGSKGVWDGNTKGPGSLTGASVTGTPSASDAGSYTAKYTPNSGYCWSDGTTNQRTVSWSIDRASISKPTAGTYEYNGSYQGPGDISYASSSGTTEAKNPGSYTAYYAPDDNHCWTNGTYSQYTLSWSISKQKVTIPKASQTVWTYNGSSHSFPAAPTHSTRSGASSITDAGTATATYKLDNTTYYVWSDGTTTNKTITFTVNKADQTWTVNPTTYTMDVNTSMSVTLSNPHGTVTWTSNDSSIVSVSGSGNSGSWAAKKKGSAKITIKAAGDNNYNAKTVVISITVNEPRIPGTDIPVDKANDPEYWQVRAFMKWKISGANTTNGKDTTIFDSLLTNDTVKKANGDDNPQSETWKIDHKTNGYDYWDITKVTEINNPSSKPTVSRYFGHNKSVVTNVAAQDKDGITIHAYKSGSTYYWVYNSGSGVVQIGSSNNNPLTGGNSATFEKTVRIANTFSSSILKPY